MRERSQIFARWWPSIGLVLTVAAYLPGAVLPYWEGKWLALHLFSWAVASFCLLREPRWPLVPRPIGLAFSSLLVLMCANLLWHNPIGFPLSLLDRASFFLLAFAFWQGVVRGECRMADLWWPLAACLAATSLWGVVQCARVGFPGEMPYSSVGSAFGYTNTTAQFLALSLLLWWGLPRPSHRAALPFLLSTSAMAVSYLILLRGRSAIAGMLLGSGLLFFLRHRGAESAKAARRFVVAGAAVALAALFLLVAFQLGKGKSWSEIAGGKIFAEKAPMTVWREDVWRQTTELIADHPLLGVGVDRFTWEFVPYHAVSARQTLSEDHIALSPHNELLRFAAEDGVPLAVLYLGAWAYLLFAWWRRRGEERLFLVPAAAFFLVEACTQFPWQNPYPVLLSALFAGQAAARLWPEGVSLGRPARGGAVVLVSLLALCLLWGDGLRVAGASRDYGRVSFACRWQPADSYHCNRVARADLENGRYAEARERLGEILRREPWNYTSLRLMSGVAQKEGDKLEACYFLWRYDSLFYDRSSMHKVLLENCPSRWLSYFHRKRPMHYFPRSSTAVHVAR